MKAKALLDLRKNKFLWIFIFSFIFLIPFYNSYTENYYKENLKTSALAYASARSINAVVSVIKNSSIELGIGVNSSIAIGEILDPINDAVERLSDILTVSIWSSGAEYILYKLTLLMPFYILVLSIALINIFLKNQILLKLTLILLILRLFMPFASGISYFADKIYFTPEIEKNVKILNSENKGDIQKLLNQETSFFSKIKISYEEIKSKMRYFFENSAKIINAIIEIGAVYLTKMLLNIIILPLLLLYILKETLKILE
ncbi:hypothetical protein [Caminibacter sp.]